MEKLSSYIEGFPEDQIIIVDYMPGPGQITFDYSLLDLETAMEKSHECLGRNFGIHENRYEYF